MIIHAEVYFPEKEKQEILNLMKEQSSCARSAYQSIKKFKFEKRSEIYAHLKKNYGDSLKAMQIYDAIDQIKYFKKSGVIFGGKNNWEKLTSGRITKDRWKETKNGTYYASGCKDNKGNRSVRITGDEILVSHPTGFRAWIKGSIFIPKKWKYVKLTCYNTRLRYRDGKFTLIISQPIDPIPFIKLSKGAIGIDSNPDGLGVAEIDRSGNLLFYTFMRSQRIQFASSEKRLHDIRILAKAIVDLALRRNKGIVLEQLNFKNKKSHNRKFNRMRHNFIYRKIIEAIKSRAEKFGIEVLEVNPAFTSILGILKYQKMYSLNRHTAAALVIARRGITIKERQTFKTSEFIKITKPIKKIIRKSRKSKTFKTKKTTTDIPTNKSGVWVNLEGRSHSHTLSLKAWSWLQGVFLKPKSGTLTGSGPDPGLIPGIGSSEGEIPSTESQRITGNLGGQKCSEVGSDLNQGNT
jgi:IS605 OrfB family transposase